MLSTSRNEPYVSFHPLTSPDQLPAHLCGDPASLLPVVRAFPMRISTHLLGMLNTPGDALARQFIPDPLELRDPCTDADPLAEEKQSPVPLIVHRYPHRVIFLVSDQCAAYCRFCMRKRRVATATREWVRSVNGGLAYILEHQEINEVVLSGGDPLMLPDDRLMAILTLLRRIAHVKILRMHTRIPIVWPQRVTPELTKCLASMPPFFVNVHCNHPREITPASALACSRLAAAGIPLGSQTVLLKGVNDRADILSRLMEGLLEMRVKPYYLHQIDRVPGTAHFRVPIETALELVAGLRGNISGMAMPHFMIDLPGGGGKLELVPDAVVKKDVGHWIIRNFQGRQFVYPTD